MTSSPRFGVLSALTIVILMLGVAASADPGDTIRVSTHSNGTQGNNESGFPALSADGRYVAFDSFATNLVDDDTNKDSDVFIHDTEDGNTTRVSTHSNGTQGNGMSFGAVISADGRYVTFHSSAPNLVDDDTNGTFDVFLHDMENGTTTLISTHSNGTQGNDTSYAGGISADGRYITFDSYASNLIDDDTNDHSDVFVHDTADGTTTRVSTHSNGTQTEGASSPKISADGRYVSFHSPASDLVDDDTNGTFDVFVHDTEGGTTTRVSIHSDGTQAEVESMWPAISADGRYVSFESEASNLVDDDTNDASDVFVHDTADSTTILVSIHSNGTQANNDSFDPAISADGRYVGFRSHAANLVDDDASFSSDVFVHDTDDGTTTRVSIHSDGTQADDDSFDPAISADGRYVGFRSFASTLVDDDTNNTSDVFVHQYLADEGDYFTDDNGHLFEDDINAIAEAGITRGCNPPENTHYCPDESFLRGEAAAFVRRALLLPATDIDHFTDDDTSVFEEDINAIADVGITMGCNPPENTMFCPTEPFTRGQAAAFIRRGLGVPATETDHFIDDNNSVFEDDINAIAEAGVTRGCNPPDNTQYCPDELLTRGQAAAFMRRALLP